MRSSRFVRAWLLVVVLLATRRAGALDRLAAVAGADVRDARGRAAAAPPPEAAGEADERRGEITERGLALEGGRSPGAVPVVSRRPWNLVVYVIDTLRADHLGSYGGTPGVTPRMDELAASSVRFAHAVSQSSWTLPAIATMLTGLSPPGHGATGPGRAIRPELATLPEALAQTGYATAAFVTNYLGSGAFGLDRGFGEFHFYRERGTSRRKVYLRSDVLHRRIVRWLDRRPQRPFLLWVHATDPHFPYLPRPRDLRFREAAPVPRGEIDEIVDALRPLHNGNEAWGARPAPMSPDMVALLRDLYAGEVRAADRSFGQLLDALAARGLLEDTVVVVTSDHGEEFLEHGGLAHGQTLHREMLHVPLLVRLPGGVGGGSVVDSLARHVDLLPTLLELVGVPVPSGLDGVPLFAPNATVPNEAYASLSLGRFAEEAVVAPSWKLIRRQHASGKVNLLLFDTARDPAERVDVSATETFRLRYGRARLETLGVPRGGGPRVGGDRLERLRALGYVTE
jgi:arylsulfatase A-like enzyme